jgi:hypothetical protein
VDTFDYNPSVTMKTDKPINARSEAAVAFKKFLEIRKDDIRKESWSKLRESKLYYYLQSDRETAPSIIYIRKATSQVRYFYLDYRRQEKIRFGGNCRCRRNFGNIQFNRIRYFQGRQMGMEQMYMSKALPYVGAGRADSYNVVEGSTSWRYLKRA